MSFLDKYSPQILGVLRIVVGLLFLEHGLMKLVGFPAPMGTGPLPPLMMAAITVLSLSGLVLYWIIELAERRAIYWQASAGNFAETGG